MYQLKWGIWQQKQRQLFEDDKKVLKTEMDNEF
jgi:hypothetical protein